MLFRVPDNLEDEAPAIARIAEMEASLKYATSQPRRWTGLLRRNTFARAVQGSNSIEGYRVTMETAIAAIQGEDPIEPKDEAWQAVDGYSAALTLILQKAIDPHFQYSAELFKSLHFMMVHYDLSKHPGLWRPGPIFVKDAATGNQVYAGPPAEQVEGLVAELVEWLRVNDSPSVVKAAMAHLNLVMIHPFSDGNGRMARALQTLVLARNGMIAPEFSSIEEYLGKNTPSYYKILARVGAGEWHPEGDAREWVRFCLYAHIVQGLVLSRRSRELQKLWDELEVLVASVGLPDRVLVALTDAAFGLRIRNTTYRGSAGVSDSVATRDLQALVRLRLLEKHGEKRGTYYLPTLAIREIREKIREPRYELPNPFDDDGHVIAMPRDLFLVGIASPKTTSPVAGQPSLPI